MTVEKVFHLCEEFVIRTIREIVQENLGDVTDFLLGTQILNTKELSLGHIREADNR